MSKQPTALVTGGAGYIGSHAVHALLDAGWRVAVIDDLSTGVRAAVPPPVPLYLGDAGDADMVGAILAREQIDAVLHFAGSVVVPESVTDPLKYYLNNTAVSRTLIQACIEAGIGRFVFSSTAAVYGTPATGRVDEDAPTRPESPYGSSKLMTETILADVAAATDLRYVTLRYFNVAGADPAGRTGQSTPDATHLIKVACQRALGQRDSLEIFGDDYDTPDGTCVRDYIHVSDLIDAHLRALDYLGRAGDSAVFNCGYGHGFSVREVLDAVAREAGADLEATIAPRRPGDPASLVADAQRLRAALGWTPRHDDLGTIVRTALAWEARLVRGARRTARHGV